MKDRQSVVVVALLVGVGVLALTRSSISVYAVVFIGVLVPSVILHEVSHGAAAYLFGDPTAKEAGRLTLNPIAHIDPFGTIILPTLLILTTSGAFGWAKPVPVNPRRMRDPRNHGLLVSLAGPATNIVLVLLSVVLIRLNMSFSEAIRALVLPEESPLSAVVLVRFSYVNVILAAFNLIPIPPLDGSAIVERVLPRQLWPGYLRLRQYSMGLLLVLIFLLPGVLGRVFRTAEDFWLRLLA